MQHGNSSLLAFLPLESKYQHHAQAMQTVGPGIAALYTDTGYGSHSTVYLSMELEL